MKYENEEEIRKDFARIFGWYKKNGMYDYGDEKPRTPTWAEIFAKIGEMKRISAISDIKNDISNLQANVSDLSSRLNNN